MKHIFLLCGLILFTSIRASEEAEGLPGGVLSFNHETGQFSLKETVVRNFGVVLSDPLPTGKVFDLPQKAVVRSLQKTTVFVFQGNLFREIPVQAQESASGSVRLTGELSGQRVVVSGSNFLKTLMLSLAEGPSESH